ncbi:uncharacterized protein C18orf19 homolog A isoform X2 [Cephus cinctus]|uniref:Uncharacterized protein C18orf19 homolog A isoform X2 n=1 Tax=Cephus cinctus TaxID=211228 RepID=A0AAJ7CGP4_CEPCN|nr:uncharacterized protein C18orf19 homolog A isoform X2 [Cephus cinctus]
MELILVRATRLSSLLLRTSTTFLPAASLATTRCQNEFYSNLLETYTHCRINPNYFALTNYVHPHRTFLSGNYLKNAVWTIHRSYSAEANKDCYTPPPVQKQSVFQRMKQMTKDYWHILIPVHVITSIGWMSLFYIAAKNGVDIVGIMEYMKLSEKYLEMLRGSSAGHWAVAYALYKVFTPLRYTITVGGTTLSIRYLNRWGYLKFKPRSNLTNKPAQKILRSAVAQMCRGAQGKVRETRVQGGTTN